MTDQKKDSLLTDLYNLVVMLTLCFAIMASAIVFSIISDLITMQLYKLHLLHNGFSGWAITAVMFFLCCRITLSALGRIIDKRWRWR